MGNAYRFAWLRNYCLKIRSQFSAIGFVLVIVSTVFYMSLVSYPSENLYHCFKYCVAGILSTVNIVLQTHISL